MSVATVRTKAASLLLLLPKFLSRPQLHFSMLNSAKHEIDPAHKCKMPTIVGILTFISMISTTSERRIARNFFICRYLSFYEQLNFRAHLKKVL